MTSTSSTKPELSIGQRMRSLYWVPGAALRISKRMNCSYKASQNMMEKPSSSTPKTVSFFELESKGIFAILPRALEKENPALSAFILPEQKEPVCHHQGSTVGELESHYDINIHGILVRKALIDLCTQIAVPVAWQRTLPDLSHSPVFEGYSGSCRIYVRTRRSWNWLNIANDVWNWVETCFNCTRNRER